MQFKIPITYKFNQFEFEISYNINFPKVSGLANNKKFTNFFGLSKNYINIV